MLQECNPHLPTNDWKVVKVEEHEGDVNQAVLVFNRKITMTVQTTQFIDILFSNYLRLKSMTGWCLRVVKNCQKRIHDKEKAELSATELLLAELKL